MSNKRMKDMVGEMEYVSDRIMAIRLRNRCKDIRIMQVYLPRTGCSEQEKERFEE